MNTDLNTRLLEWFEKNTPPGDWLVSSQCRIAVIWATLYTRGVSLDEIEKMTDIFLDIFNLEFAS